MTENNGNVARRVSNHKIKKHKKKRYLLKFTIFVLVCVAIWFATHIPYFNVNGIAVMGNQEITDEAVIKASGVKTGESIFNAEPLWVQHKIKKNNLYVDTAKVRRKFPDKVTITITEKSAMAQIKKGKNYVVTDIDGTVIEVAKEERKATLIDNITVKSAQRKEVVNVKEQDVLNKALDLIIAADENDMYFKRVDIKDSNVDAYIYDDLVCKGKYKNLMSCLKSGTLKSVVYDLYQKDKEKGTITISRNNYCFFTPKK